MKTYTIVFSNKTPFGDEIKEITHLQASQFKDAFHEVVAYLFPQLSKKM